MSLIYGTSTPPILFSNDVKAIERFTGMTAEFFSTRRSEDDSALLWMRTDSNGCMFHQEGQCSIYPVRPLDCKLFPFDIMEMADGQLDMIVYTSLCSIDFNTNAHRYLENLEKAIRLVPQLEDNLRTYARVPTPGMDEQSCLKLVVIA